MLYFRLPGCCFNTTIVLLALEATTQGKRGFYVIAINIHVLPLGFDH